MNMKLDREQLFKIAGITGKTYTPVTVGRRNKTTKPMNVWADQFYNLNFTNMDELRQITPENVTAKTVYTMEDGNFVPVSNDWKAIVGDETKETYSFHSDNYEIVQHSTIVNAMSYACEDTSLSVFGHFDESSGKFNGYGSFANPDVHIDLFEEKDDPVMLGMRFFNSHNGDSKFGGEIFGIRYVCGNYMAWGDVLGKISIKHFKSEENVADELGKILRGFVDKIDALKDRVHYIRDTVLTVEEQEAVLWGIGMKDKQVQNIMTYKTFLNPEIKPESVSAFDIYNSSTAYISYRVGGSHMVQNNLGASDRIQALLTRNIDSIIEDGLKIKAKYSEENPADKTQTRIEVFA